MVDRLDLVRKAKPDWFGVTEDTGDTISGRAVVPVPRAADDYVIDLTISGHFLVSVGETVPGTKIPAWCPERHMNWEPTFCIGLNAGLNIQDDDSAHVWWLLLREFLLLQRIASKTRRWPRHKELAHGDAGVHQVEAAAAADALGLKEQYADMLQGAATWFSDGDFYVDDVGRLSGPAGAKCPVKTCNHAIDGTRFQDCCQIDQVKTLVKSESLRRRANEEFWERYLGWECCSSMDGCPLQALNSSRP